MLKKYNLFHAVETLNADLFEHLLATGGNILEKDQYGHTVLEVLEENIANYECQRAKYKKYEIEYPYLMDLGALIDMRTMAESIKE